MIYSRSSEYAIRAFVHLAQVTDAKYVMVKHIAEQEGIPAHFLAKILQQLARKGLLRSSKGPTGGFCLRQPAEDITLFSIVEALDGMTDYEKCISGLSECSDEAPCGMHDSWKELRLRILDYLEGTSIADLARALDDKRKLLAKGKKPRKSAVARKN